MVESSEMFLFTSSRGYGAAPRIYKLESLLCGGRTGSHKFEHKTTSDTLNLKIN